MKLQESLGQSVSAVMHEHQHESTPDRSCVSGASHVIVVGGLGALGSLSATWLMQQGCRTQTLLGRSGQAAPGVLGPLLSSHPQVCLFSRETLSTIIMPDLIRSINISVLCLQHNTSRQ